MAIEVVATKNGPYLLTGDLSQLVFPVSTYGTDLRL